MGTPPGSQPHQGIDRFLRELRETADRRTGDRRARSASVPSDRRKGADRRLADRRQYDREWFAVEDAAHVQAMIMSRTVRLACPECDGNIIVGPPNLRSGYSACRIQCTACYRIGFVRADIVDP